MYYDVLPSACNCIQITRKEQVKKLRATTHSHLNHADVSAGGLTLHPCGSEALASEENCVVVVLGVIRVAFLLHKRPAAHVLQAPRWVASFNEADRLREREKKEVFTTQP